MIDGGMVVRLTEKRLVNVAEASFNLLGRVDELFYSDPCCDNVNKCEKGMPKLFIACGNTAKLL
jgi:hypothetical protein